MIGVKFICFIGLATVCILVFTPGYSFSQATWALSYGGSGSDYADSIQQTSDGGYIVAGGTSSFGAGLSDFWVLKLDASGGIIWQKTYGGHYYDASKSIQQTSDGGYIVAGYAQSFTAYGNEDFWVLKLDADGGIIWQKTYGDGSGNDDAYSIHQTSDGGFIVAGHTGLISGGGAWVLKLDAGGEIIWQKTYGGNEDDYLWDMQKTSDGGCIIVGQTNSFGAGNGDFWVLKLNANGEIVWQKTYGGSDYDAAYAVQQTSDGGYIIAGGSMSFGSGSYALWVIKLDASGRMATSCSFIGDTSVTPGSISIIPSNSSASITTTSIVPSSTSVSAESTEVLPIGQCAFDIYLLPYLGLKPVVDDSGSSTPNGIIEPNESVSLQGHLQNIGTVDAINTTGILNTTDPIAITQPDAVYGTIASDSDQLCTTCYALTAPLVNRSAMHWDFHVTEQASANTYGPVGFHYIYHVGYSFSDVPPSQMFYSYIEKLLHAGVTGGCTSSKYCPSAIVQRQTMAKFICAAMNSVEPGNCWIPSSCGGIFADVPASNIFCPYIEGLYISDIVNGCNDSPLQYCPESNVTRDSIAKFVCNGMNAIALGSCAITSCTGIFTDVPSSNLFCGYIEGLYNAGVTSGCGTGIYCPYNYVSRDQIAKLLVNAFEFTL